MQYTRSPCDDYQSMPLLYGQPFRGETQSLIIAKIRRNRNAIEVFTPFAILQRTDIEPYDEHGE